LRPALREYRMRLYGTNLYRSESRMKRAEKREHLIDVAADLFNRCGYHGVGVDRVIAEAGIAKTTLYRHFKSKEELIVAVLRRTDEQFRTDMRASVDKAASEPNRKLLATFDFLERWFRQKTFFGCPFMSAAGEYSERSSPVFREVESHKRLLLAYFEELARAARLKNPKNVADQIGLLHEGATAVAHISGARDAAREAKSIAAILVGEQTASARQ